ncbi:ABC transporter permease [Leekyejoonella antrihumi]|uniref:ABC transporter permease subunit n=1 Tax=Leekyejoonella antrihumi TaxID=1660198 RepID=A0A563DWS3_9MICO|nr:ABC transporter permease subunit [Leekyejoonella antrihumi]TWP34676.1 ABC transporter permease subunit [Leekyejoonella antrihumi]
MKLISEPLSLLKRIVLGVIGTLGIGLILEVLIRTRVISGAGLPLPSAVVRQGYHLLGNTAFLTQVFYTLREWMLGLLIASVVGVILGGLMGAIPTVFTMFSLPVEVLRPLPAIAIGPLLLLLLGTSMLPMSLTVAAACVWPILFNAMYAMRSVDPVAVQTAKTMHVSPLGIMARVRLPASLPFMFTGIRVSASIGLIVAVSVELLLGSGGGIGGYILLASTSASNLDVVYAATAVTGLLGVLVSGLFALADRAAFGWKKGLAQ